MIIERYIEVVRDALGEILKLGDRLTMPLSLLLGLAILAATVAWVVERRAGEDSMVGWRHLAGAGLGYGTVALVLVTGWSALRATRFVEQNEMRRRERAAATTNPVPDAPVVSQAGPAVAILRERTYNSTLTLPPSFLNRLGEEGVGVLAPYLEDSTAANVIRLRNSFRRSGRNVVFTRQSTVQEEEPMPLSESRIKVTFSRLSGRAYDANFEARYGFRNASDKPVTAHFLFSLPQAGTLRDLSVRVEKPGEAGPPSEAPAAPGGEANVAADGSGTYEWKGEMAPGESRQALVSYRVTGARTWSYGLGSQRRRVEKFQLDAETGGDIRFARGSLQPTSTRGSELGWQLSNVITAQQLSLVFPSDKEGDQLYIQALTVLPVCLLLFAGGVLALASWTARPLPPLRLGAALALFAIGLGACTVAPTYSSPLFALLAAPLAGAAIAGATLGRRFLLAAIPIALLPAAFLSAHHTGLLVLILGALTFGALALARRRRWMA